MSRLIRRGIDAQIDEITRRHQLRKIVSYGFWIALVGAGVILFAERLALADVVADYNRCIAEYALAVLPPGSPAELVVQTLVVK